jgi:hypothetical protein
MITNDMYFGGRVPCVRKNLVFENKTQPYFPNTLGLVERTTKLPKTKDSYQ